MSSCAELDYLEMLLIDGDSWMFEGEYDTAESGIEMPEGSSTFRVYLHDGLPGVRLYLVDPGKMNSFAFVVNEYGEVEGKICDLFSWADDFDYTAFQAMVRDAWYSRR